jgi:integrase
MTTGHLAYNLYKRTTKDGPVFHARFWSDAESRFVKTVSCETSDKNAARRKAEGLLRDGIVPSVDDPEVLAYLIGFWAPGSLYARAKALRGAPLSPRYIKLNADAVRLQVKPYAALAGKHVSELTPGLVDRWLIWLQDNGRGQRTINIALQALRVAVRRWAKARRSPDPLEGVQKVAERPQARGSLSLPEIRLLLALEPGKDKRVWCGALLGCLAGLRLGEVRGLRWEDVDKEHGLIHVVQSVPAFERTPRAPKWGSTGEVPAPTMLLDALDMLAESAPYGRMGYVIYSADQGEPVGTEFLCGGFMRMLEAIGIGAKARAERRLSFHSLRHSFVSLSRLAGIPDFLVQRYARHKSPGMMEQYSHSEIIDFSDARKKLAAVVKPKKPRKAAAGV